ncbi:MAG: cobalamin biosynthesis protein [Victivallales bacterium]
MIFAGESADISVAVPGTDTVLRMVPFRFSLGIGCRKGTSCGEIGKAVNVVLERYGISMDAVAVVASAVDGRRRKRDCSISRKISERAALFRGGAVENTRPVPNPSKHAIGASRNSLPLSEASALLGAGEGGTLFAEKTVFDAVTVALAKMRESDGRDSGFQGGTNQEYPAFLIGGVNSGSGKTTLALALMRAFARRAACRVN